MAAYRRVYGFGHLRADCRGPGSAPEPYAHFEYATIYKILYMIGPSLYSHSTAIRPRYDRLTTYVTNIVCWLLY